MKKVGLISHLLPFLIILVCFSVGFSSWILPMPEAPTSSSGGSISASPVYNAEYYITSNKMTTFEYTTLYFLQYNEDTESGSDSDEKIATDKGYITVEYEVDLAKLKEALGVDTLNSATMRFTLSASNVIGEYLLFSSFNSDVGENKVSVQINDLNINSTDITVTVAESENEDDSPLKIDSGIITYTCKMAMKCPDGSDALTSIDEDATLTFTVVYELTVPPGANFRESFGQYIRNFDNDDKTEFVTTAVAIGS